MPSQFHMLSMPQIILDAVLVDNPKIRTCWILDLHSVNGLHLICIFAIFSLVIPQTFAPSQSTPPSQCELCLVYFLLLIWFLIKFLFYFVHTMNIKEYKESVHEYKKYKHVTQHNESTFTHALEATCDHSQCKTSTSVPKISITLNILQLFSCTHSCLIISLNNLVLCVRILYEWLSYCMDVFFCVLYLHTMRCLWFGLDNVINTSNSFLQLCFSFCGHTVWVYNDVFLCCPVIEPLHCLQFLAIRNNAAMNILAHAPWYALGICQEAMLPGYSRCASSNLQDNAKLFLHTLVGILYLSQHCLRILIAVRRSGSPL